jgi:TrmH family RNA methyltransferase
MLSKAKIKYIRSLELKKFRREENVFVAEGPKVVGELLPHLHCRLLAALPEWLSAHCGVRADEVYEVTADELRHASFLRTPQDVLAVFEQPAILANPTVSGLCLALDDVQDPGNVGTIIRLADWFGIRQVFCSTGTADAFSPKVVQATMGALARVSIHTVDLPSLLHAIPAGTPVYGTFLEGDNIYDAPLGSEGVIVMGNEGNGISPSVAKAVTHKLFIPPYPLHAETSESLNVAIATAITCAEFRRRQQSTQ